MFIIIEKRKRKSQHTEKGRCVIKFASLFSAQIFYTCKTIFLLSISSFFLSSFPPFFYINEIVCYYCVMQGLQDQRSPTNIFLDIIKKKENGAKQQKKSVQSHHHCVRQSSWITHRDIYRIKITIQSISPSFPVF